MSLFQIEDLVVDVPGRRLLDGRLGRRLHARVELGHAHFGRGGVLLGGIGTGLHGLAQRPPGRIFAQYLAGLLAGGIAEA